MTPFLLDHNLREREYTHKEIDKDFKHAILISMELIII